MTILAKFCQIWSFIGVISLTKSRARYVVLPRVCLSLKGSVLQRPAKLYFHCWSYAAKVCKTAFHSIQTQSKTAKRRFRYLTNDAKGLQLQISLPPVNWRIVAAKATLHFTLQEACTLLNTACQQMVQSDSSSFFKPGTCHLCACLDYWQPKALNASSFRFCQYYNKAIKQSHNLRQLAKKTKIRPNQSGGQGIACVKAIDRAPTNHLTGPLP